MPVRRRFGVRATAVDAVARNVALLRAFRDLERRRVAAGATIAVVVVAAIARLVLVARPGWLATIGAAGLAAALFAGVTFGIAALARPVPLRRALETYRWVVREDARRWRAATVDAPPRTPARARTWLETHPAAGGSSDLPRIELLIWIGEFDAARRVADALSTVTTGDRFERALRRASIDFIATGDGDLDRVRDAIDELPAAERLHARARLAVEEARQAAALGSSRDCLVPLGRAREELGGAIDGFRLLPDLARWVARPLLILGAVCAVALFVVAGALPPR